MIYIKNMSTWKITKKINLKLVKLSQLTNLAKFNKLELEINFIENREIIQ